MQIENILNLENTVEAVFYDHPLVPAILVVKNRWSQNTGQFQGKTLNWCHKFWPQMTGGHKTRWS